MILVLLIVATILLGLRAFRVNAGLVDLGWLGAAIFVLTFMLAAAGV